MQGLVWHFNYKLPYVKKRNYNRLESKQNLFVSQTILLEKICFAINWKYQVT